MKRYLQIAASKREIGDDAFARLCEVIPGDYISVFQARLRDDSAEWAAVRRVLEEAGCRQRSQFEDSGPGKFSCHPNYDYEESDIDRADYFQLRPRDYVETNGWRSPEGHLYLKPSWLPRKGPLLGADGFGIIVSSELRAELEAAGFAGLAFRPTRVRRERRSDGAEDVPWEKVGCAPYWELTGSVRLPSLSPRCRLVDSRQGQPIKDDDWSKGVMLIEGEFPAGELHYRRADIQRVEPFDFASTHEPLGRCHPKLILSRRVYDWVLTRKLKTDWLPVYVDDE